MKLLVSSWLSVGQLFDDHALPFLRTTLLASSLIQSIVELSLGFSGDQPLKVTGRTVKSVAVPQL